MAKELSALETQLRESRSKTDSTTLVFKILESKDIESKPSIYLPKSLQNMDETMAVIVFYSRYIIAIARDFSSSPVDYDLILASYGFLDGYEYPEVQDRHIQYCQNVGVYADGKNIPLIAHWADEDIDKSLRTKENSAIKKMANKLEKRLVKNGGVLGYGAEAEKLIGSPFPPPNYLQGYGYRKCEYDGKAFYVPLTDKELRLLANTFIGENYVESLNENHIKSNDPDMPSDISNTRDNMNDDKNHQTNTEKELKSSQPEHEDKISDSFLSKEVAFRSTLPDNSEEGSTEQNGNKNTGETEEKSPPENPDKDNLLSYIRLAVIALFSISAILAVALIIKPWWIEKANKRETTIMSAAPAPNVLSIEEIPIDSALQVEMESFSIDEDDKIIPLAPGYSKKLPIKDPSPPDAAISTLEIQSSDEHVVWEKDGYLTASDDIPAGESIDVYITIIARKHKEIICVKVENPEISDDAEGLIGGGDAK